MDLGAIQKSLNFDPLVFVIQAALFIFLWLVLNAIFWKPILGHIAARNRTIDEKYAQREDLQHEMEALRADYMARIAIVEAEARAHIQNAIKEAQSERERLISEARASAEASLKQGVADLEREKAEALQALRTQMTGLALSIADTAMASTIDRQTLQRAVEIGVQSGAGAAANAARN